MHTLIIFARQPIIGHTKTRLCPPLSHETAAALYACFLRDVLDQASQIAGAQPLIAHTPESELAFFELFAPGIECRSQRGHTLGARMDNCFSDLFAAAEQDAPAQPATTAQHAVLIGSDSPDLPVEYLREAFVRLAAGADLVLGPAEDGGYYLIGLRAAQPNLLHDIPTSTPTVLADTLARAAARGLQVALLPPWYDVDTIAALAQLAAALRDAPAHIAPSTRAFLPQIQIELLV